MRTRLLAATAAAACVVMGSVPAAAQTACTVSPCAIQANDNFAVAADHDTLDTDTYRLYQNGTIAAQVPVTTNLNGVIQFVIASGLSRGTYVFYIEAIGPGGATGSSTITLTVTAGNPKAPGQIRIVNIAWRTPDGWRTTVVRVI